MVPIAGSGTALRLSSDQSHKMRSIHIRHPMIGLIKSGQKTLFRNQSPLKIKADELFVLQKGSHWDMLNDTLGKPYYCTHIINLSGEIIQLFYQYYPQFKSAPLQDYVTTKSEVLSECFQRTWSSLNNQNLSEALKQHRTLELLLQLAEQQILFPLTVSWTDKVQALVENNLAKTWTLGEVADFFYISESTLKRRLLQENTSFRKWLQELRLDTALSLILSSNQSLSAIAQTCGYHSQSRFSEAFKKRFDILPSMIKTNKMAELS